MSLVWLFGKQFVCRSFHWVVVVQSCPQFYFSEPGMCLAYFEKFGYNETSGNCQKFVYGGCPGNENRFDTMADCQKICPGNVHPWTTHGAASMPVVPFVKIGFGLLFAILLQ